MSTVDRNALREFLDNNGCKTTDECMEALEPFFVIAETGKYVLKPLKEIDKKAVKQAIHLTTGQEVEKIILLSTKNLFSKPRWMSQVAYKDTLQCSLHIDLEHRTTEHVKRSGMSSSNQILVSMLGKLNSKLYHRVTHDLKAIRIFGIWNQVSSYLWVNLFNFSNLHLANKPKQANEFKPLLAILSNCIPLGFKEDEPTTLVVLVA